MKKNIDDSEKLNLSPEAEALWEVFIQLQGISKNSGKRAVLLEGLKAFDVCRAAEKEIKQDGLCVRDKFNQLKTHPATATMRDARSQYLLCLKMLRLNLYEPPFEL